MSFSEMINMLVGRTFTRKYWKSGTHISYGYLASDNKHKHPCIILHRPGFKPKKFIANINDLKGVDWYEVGMEK